MLEKLWSSIRNEVVTSQENSEVISLEILDQPVYQPHLIRRLPVHWQNLVKEDRLADTLTYHQQKAGFELPNENPRYIGTLIHQILQQYWHYSAFRPLQEDIIQSVLAGSDTLALLPTGGGKSICFQEPGEKFV